MNNYIPAAGYPAAQHFDNLIVNNNFPLALETLHLRAADRIKRERGGGFAGQIADVDGDCRKFAECLASVTFPEQNLIGFDRPANIYLVSEIYQVGGHRGILEQLIRARPSERHVVIFTCAFENNREYGLRRVSEMGALPLAPDTSLNLYEKLQWLRNKLAAFAARRAFLLHHPEDVIATVAAYEIEPRYKKRLYFIRHADTVPSLGSSLFEATHVAIRTEQRRAIQSSLPNTSVVLLPLSYDSSLLQPPLAPDIEEYISNPFRGFFNSSHFVTATCGGSHKFVSTGPLGLPNLIRGILRNPFRRHVHVGPLTPELSSAIFSALDEEKIPRSRLKLSGEVRSVAEALAAEKVDLFIASIPIGGGLTICEAAYVGLPIAVHHPPGGGPLERYLSGESFRPSHVIAWSTPKELFSALDAINESKLFELSKASREWFNRQVSPSRFEKRYAAIIALSEGRMRENVRLKTSSRDLELFDSLFYKEFYKDVSEAELDPLTHYTQFGRAEGRQPNALFSPRYYISQLPTAERPIAKINPLSHYLARGERAGYSPHPLFSPQVCALSLQQLGLQIDVTSTLLEQYLLSNLPIRPHVLFDPQHYEAQLPMPGMLREPHLAHFLRIGADAGFSPHPLVDMKRIGGLATFLDFMEGGHSRLSPHVLFDTDYYLQLVRHRPCCSAPNLLWEYLIEGNSAEHRPHPLVSPRYVEQKTPGNLQSTLTILERLAKNELNADAHPLVSEEYIYKQAPWVKGAPFSVTEFFIRYGSAQNISPHAWFSTNYYLSMHGDVARAGVNPLVHFLCNGDQEGRAPHPFFDPNFYRSTWMGPADPSNTLVSYLERGTGHFFHVQSYDGGLQHLTLKLSKRSLAAGSRNAAISYLHEGLHSEWAAPHPTLISEIRSFVIDARHLDPDIEENVLFDQAVVPVHRPSIVSSGPIPAPAGSYTAPKGSSVCFKNATAVGGNDGLIANDVWYDPGLLGFDAETMLAKHSSAVFAVSGADVLLRRFDTCEYFVSAIHACGSYSHNYFHFLFEVLPRALMAAKHAPIGTPLLADAGMPKQHYQALKLLLPNNPITQIQRNQSVRVATLYASSMPCLVHDAFGKSVPPTDSVRYHPEVLQMLAAYADSQRATEKGKKIFLRREGSIRRLLNLDEIQTELVGRGFEVVSCDKLDFWAQVTLFANADTIVAPTGAHLANLVFAPPGCQVFPLYSDAPGTNYYLWSALGDSLGHRVVNIAGPRVAGSVAGRAPEAHEDYTVPVSMVTPFFQTVDTHRVDSGTLGPVQRPQAALEALNRLVDANNDAAVLTSAWSVLADNGVADDFFHHLRARREEFLGLVASLDRNEVGRIFEHPVYANFNSNLRSGLVLQPYAGTAIFDYTTCFGEWSRIAAKDDQDRLTRVRALLGAMLCHQPWELELLSDLSDLPEGAIQDRYLAWVTSQPFLVTPTDEDAYATFALKLLQWFDYHLSESRDLEQLAKIRRSVQGIDLGKLLLIEKPLNSIHLARNQILEKLAIRTPPRRKTVRAADGSEGRRRIGILFRTFAKGPDSESVVAFLRDFDHSKWEVFGYSMGYADRVAQDDPGFDLELEATFDVRYTLENDPDSIRRVLLRDELDVFLYANATAYGVTAFDLALYMRIAPLQVVLNSHLPLPLGYPSFDAFLTGESDAPNREVEQEDYKETLVRVRGPVINYLSSLDPRPDMNLSRASLNLSSEDVVLLCAGSLSKLGWNFLTTAMRSANETPNAKLVLAPYNPGWAGVSLAFPFLTQVTLCARKVGFDTQRLRILGELSVAEAEAIVEMADIYLTPFPHGGATMLHLALVRGVPPIVLRRESTRSIDQFLVESLGLPELLANSPMEYVQIAQSLARDSVAREALSMKIRNGDKSTLVRNPKYSKQMQSVIEGMINQDGRVTI